MATLVGVDLHAREQSMATLDTTTGERQDLRIRHDGDEVERFYAALPPPVTVAIESTGYAMWFPRAHASARPHRGRRGCREDPRERGPQNEDRPPGRAPHLDPAGREPLPRHLGSRSDDPRLAGAHRPSDAAGAPAYDGPQRVHAIALNYRLALGSSLFTRRGLAALRALPLPRHTARRRDESLELLTWLDAHTGELDGQIATAASADPEACRLMTHPGVGPLTALATISSAISRLAC
jgi:transposase